MTEEEHGAAAWLRGIIGEFEANDEQNCSSMARMFGIDCKYETCRDCMTKMMTAITDRIDREMAEKERLKKENDELKAELDDWKGNAEGFQPDAYMKLPVDADGVPVCIGDEVNIDGDAMTVLGYRLHNDMLLLVAKDKKSGLFFIPEPSRARHFKYARPDSWERLEHDATLAPRDYLEARGLKERKDGRIAAMMGDLVSRAKALAKAGDGE